MDAVTLLLIALSTARITRLITTDRITERFRNMVVRRLGQDSEISYLVFCDWCVSIYVGLSVSAAAWVLGSATAFSVVAVGLSASYVTGWLASRTED